MSLKSIILSISLIVVMITIMYFFGMPMGLLFATILILSESIVFTVKKDSYFKFLEFINPKAYKIYSDRGEEFLEKTRKQNLVYMYIGGGVALLNTIIQLISQRFRNSSSYKIDSDLLLIMIVITVIVLGLSYFTNRYLIKKVKDGISHKELLTRQIIVGVVLGVLLVGIVFAFLIVYSFLTYGPNKNC